MCPRRIHLHQLSHFSKLHSYSFLLQMNKLRLPMKCPVLWMR
uniref:Uncharacterized protein n=1 Tax=Picea glauca TaxID=3330 RepID=A0A101LUW0_PICGL|nr:hypothetical protein ABT39_MTgene2362 [Picea glauca]QHR92260.1 hypothetical protein Q903MT_gene6299 [Picea sitchensis]